MVECVAMGKESINRGSEWQKWDLHIHSPKTFLSNQYGGCSDDEFIQKIKNEGISCIGLTNYFKFEDDFAERKYKIEQEGIVVFPNLEFRTQPQNKEKQEIHLHILFSNQVPIDDINSFLGRLKTVDGKKYCKDLTMDDIKNVSIGIDTLERALAEDTDIRPLDHYLLIACPRGQGNFRPSSDDDGRGKAFAKKIDERSDALFGKSEDRDHFLDKSRYSGAVQKPVLFCSDAHCLDQIGTGFSWIKADPTFEGLKQVLYEPKERVEIQELKPENKNSVPIIDHISYKDKDGKEEKVYFNQNLNSVIGSRGSGKSNLIKNIAYCVDDAECKSRGVIEEKGKGLAFLEYDSFNVSWSGGSENAKGKILLMPQNYLDNMVYSTKESNENFNKFIKERLNSNESFVTTMERVDAFNNKNTSKVESIISTIISLDEKIETAVEFIKRIGDEEMLRKQEKNLDDSIKQIREKVDLTAEDSERYEKLDKEKNEGKKRLDELRSDVQSFERLKGIDFFDENIFSNFEFTEVSQKEIKDELNKGFTNLKNDFIPEKIKELHGEIKKTEKEVLEKEENLKPLSEKIKKNKELEGLVKQKNEVFGNIEKAVQKKKEIEENRKLVEYNSDLLVQTYKQFEVEGNAILESLNIGDMQSINIEKRLSFNDKSFDNFKDEFINKRDTARLLDKIFPNKDTIERFNNGEIHLRSQKEKRGFLNSLFENRHSIDYTKNIVLKGKGIPLSDMSGGEKIISLLELIFTFDTHQYPILIDQPEDALDVRIISTEIVNFIKGQKKKRQIIIVSHNANLVIGGDSELVIVAENSNGSFKYTSGAIESSVIRDNIINILEGGEEAFRKRRDKLRINM